MIKSIYLDKLSIGLSALCTIHCLLLPILAVFLPVVSSSWVADEHFHEYMLYAVLPISTLALFMGCRKHKSFFVAGLGICGLTLLTYITINHESFSDFAEKLFSVIAVSIIAVSHYRNYKLCRNSKCECSH